MGRDRLPQAESEEVFRTVAPQLTIALSNLQPMMCLEGKINIPGLRRQRLLGRSACRMSMFGSGTV